MHYFPYDNPWHAENSNVVVADFNGDNISDFFIITSTEKSFQIHLGSADWQSIEQPYLVSDSKHAQHLSQLQDYDFYTGRFSSADKSDLLFISRSNQALNNKLLSLDNGGLTISTSFDINNVLSGHKILIADFNQDLLDDIFLQATDGIKDHYLALNNSESHASVELIKVESSASLPNDNSLYFIANDVDQDGTLDIVTSSSASLVNRDNCSGTMNLAT